MLSVCPATEPAFHQSHDSASLADNVLPEIVQNSLLSGDNVDTLDTLEKDLLVVSPYTEAPHLLDLRTLNTANTILAKALVSMKSIREDYATAPYVDSFNWPEVMERVCAEAVAANYNWEEQSFYIVVFRSQIPPTTVYADLGALDKAAHAEATKSGGFLK